MIVHLSETLRLRTLIGGIGIDPTLAETATDTFERFIGRLANGPFKLRSKDEAAPHFGEISRTLSAVMPRDVPIEGIHTISLEELIGKSPSEQLPLYALCNAGSVHAMLRATPCHAEAMRGVVGTGLNKALKAVLKTGQLKKILRRSAYGGFTDLLAQSITTYFTCLFAHAVRNDGRMVERLLPLAKIFRANMPIGAHVQGPGTVTHWTIFTA